MGAGAVSASKDVARREPDAFAAWLGDPAAAPHGGELFAALIQRTRAWLAQALEREGATLAVTHAAVIRAAIVVALGAGPDAFWRSMSRRCRSPASAVARDAGILWRSGLCGSSREGFAAALRAAPEELRLEAGAGSGDGFVVPDSGSATCCQPAPSCPRRLYDLRLTPRNADRGPRPEAPAQRPRRTLEEAIS